MLVSIDQGHFRGSEFAIAKARRALDQTRFPSVGDTEYVIMRQLNITAEISQLTTQYYRQSEKIISSRVYGWTESAINADCIWFATEVDLYACFSRDIALGKVGVLWFWKSFSQLSGFSISESLFNVFQQQSSQLPALIQRLFEQHELPLVWNQLSELHAKSLSEKIVPESVGEMIRFAGSAALPMDNQITVIQLAPLLWTLLKGTNIQAGKLSAKQQLAIMLYLQIEKPHWLHSTTSTELINQLVQQILFVPGNGLTKSKTLIEREGALTTGLSEDSTNQTLQSGLVSVKISRQDNQVSSTNQTERVNEDSKISTLQSLDNKSESKFDSIKDQLLDFVDQDNGGVSTDDTPDQQTEFSCFEEWDVSQGGLFYLLNILNQPVIRQRLLNDKKAIAFPSGWGWLYRLGEAFGLQQERPLVRCLSVLSGVDENTFLTTMPELETTDEILAYAERRYQGCGFWKPALLNKPAYITFKRPELSITFSMQDVDIDLRRSGLDIDPVWVDWLGALVRFHYRDGV